MDDREHQTGILFLLADGRTYANAAVADLQNCLCDLAPLVSQLNTIQTLDRRFFISSAMVWLPFPANWFTQVRTRKFVPNCRAVQNSSEMSLSRSPMWTQRWGVMQKSGGLAQILQPTVACLHFDRYSCGWIFFFSALQP